MDDRKAPRANPAADRGQPPAGTAPATRTRFTPGARLRWQHASPRRALRATGALLCAALAGTSLAQPALPDVTVTSNPLDPQALESAQPASVLRGEQLERQRGISLGETLSQQPGIHQSGFSSGASRPVIRGLDGPRVQVVHDGLDAGDLSAMSPDHAVAIDPLDLRAIEVLRGPATLLHGAGAGAGLVNVVTERIPVTRHSGVRGDAHAAADSATRGHSASAALRGGSGPWNWTLSAFDRFAGDYRFPGPAVVRDPASARGRLPNSFAQGDGLGAGLSWVGSRGVIGASFSELSNRYGIPGAEDASIRLRRQRSELLAEADQPLPGIARLRASWAGARYRHDEIESAGGVTAASFANRLSDGRIEAQHEPVAGVRGVFGVQSRGRELGVSGEEAYLPGARERSEALFYVGERRYGDARVDFGWRHERARTTPEDPGAHPARSFGLNALSAATTLPLARDLALVAGVTGAQRAPAIEELYANGPHLAAGTFEIGNAALRAERSTNFDLGLRGASGRLQWKAGVFHHRFSSYVYGRTTDENGDGIADRVDEHQNVANSAADPGGGALTRLRYAQAPARLNGVEFELAWRPQGSPFGVRGFGDTARGRIDGDGNLPRMAPARIGAALDYRQGPWSGFVSLLSVRRQDRLATLETPTDGYLRVDAEIAWTVADASRRLTLFVQGRNLLDEQIRVHTSFVKESVPQPGRSILAGLRARF